MNERKSPLLLIQNLNVYTGDLCTLRDITLQASVGEILACIGPKDSGASALLPVLNRTEETDVRVQGRITLQGMDIFSEMHPFELRRRIGMIFDRPNTFPMSIFDNVAFGPRMRRERRRTVLNQLVEQALQEAELWSEVKDRLRQPARCLSEGQRQRLCIARALVMEPEVLLLEEPTGRLDPIATGRIEQLIERLKQHMAIILVPHTVQQASRVSDRAAFFLDGELLETAPTMQLFTQPQRQETADYISGRYL